MPGVEWLNFESVFLLSGLLSLLTGPMGESCWAAEPKEFPLKEECSMPAKESRNWRRPARFCNIDIIVSTLLQGTILSSMPHNI